MEFCGFSKENFGVEKGMTILENSRMNLEF